MRWVSHVIIAGSTTALVSPVLVPIAIAGSTAPDWLEWVFKAFGYPVQHRTKTHYFSFWLICFILSYLIGEWRGIFMAFFYGGFTHVLADSLTVSGVPFSPMSDRSFTLFGGRLRTGEPTEYFVSFGVAFVCLLMHSIFMQSSGEFTPYYFERGKLYREGVISAKEWRDKRFSFF